MTKQTTERSDTFGAQVADHVAGQVRELVDHLTRQDLSLTLPQIRELADRASSAATDAAITEVRAYLSGSGSSPIAERIGSVYLVADLTRWLASSSKDLTEEAVRKRAKHRQLVAFLTDDRKWAFPAWQFDRVGGKLVPRQPVIDLWKRLPTDSFLTDVDLAVWMATRLKSLDGTPAEHVHRHGIGSAPLQHAISRLSERAA